MWRILLYVTGSVTILAESGSPEQLLRKLSRYGIFLAKICIPDRCSVRIQIPARQWKKAEQIITKDGGSCQMIQQQGLPFLCKGLWRRPGFLALLILAVLLAVLLPKFVFFYEVEGNDTVSAEEILYELRSLGVGFGTYGPSIHPQELKNEMLYRIPKLRWFTVQQSGMRAKIIVREREEVLPVRNTRQPTNVVASRSGIVTRVDCYAGNCLCKKGQAVAQGELLVSAYTDLEFKTQVSAALAEIYAQTIRRFESVLPEERSVRGEKTDTYRIIRLCIGNRAFTLKGRKNMTKDALQSVEYRPLRLPGGFLFPLGIEITTVCEYDMKEEAYSQSQAEAYLQKTAQQYVQEDMIAGTVLSSQLHMKSGGKGFRAACVFQCEEMIARMTAASIKEVQNEYG